MDVSLSLESHIPTEHIPLDHEATRPDDDDDKAKEEEEDGEFRIIYFLRHIHFSGELRRFNPSVQWMCSPIGKGGGQPKVTIDPQK